MVLNSNLSIFSAIGIEIEYMIIDQITLDIMPIADKVLLNFAGEITNEIELGEIAISNELVKHVIEFKTNGPKRFSKDLDLLFHSALKKINAFLKDHDAMLLPTGMHPWLNPTKGIELWPYGDKKIYACYDRIFNCRGHGWSNLQSMHINLPFANDLEFKKLHNAIRIVLPFIPSLTASSPFVEGKRSHWLDARLDFYRKNQKKIPLIAGHIIPEFITNEHCYKKAILFPIYQSVEPYDPEGLLRDEWVNSRGAIARFDRMAIEIRVVDTQECPLADITLAYFIQQFLSYLVQHTDAYLLKPLESKQLKDTFIKCSKYGSTALIDDLALLKQFELELPTKIQAKAFWLSVAEQLRGRYLPETRYHQIVKLVEAGTLAERILRVTGDHPNHTELRETYRSISHCLKENQLFLP